MSEIALPRVKRRIVLSNRLRLVDLPRSQRWYVAGLLAVALAAGLLILLVGMNAHPFGSSIIVPQSLLPASVPESGYVVSFSMLMLVLLGFGCVSAALVYGSYLPGWEAPDLTRLGIGILATLLPLHLLRFGMVDVGSRQASLLRGSIELQFHALITVVALICGVAALAFALKKLPRAAFWNPLLVFAVFSLLALALVMYHQFWPRGSNTFSAEMLPVITIYWLMVPLAGLVNIFFFWQLIAEAKIFTREIGVRVANRFTRLPGLLTALFAVKLLWLAGSYFDITPNSYGNPWQRVESNFESGTFLIAAVLAVAAILLLMRARMTFDPNQQKRGAAVFVIGFLFGFIVLWVSYFLFHLLFNLEQYPEMTANSLYGCITLSHGSPAAAAGCAINSFTDWGAKLTVIFTLALLPIGWLLSRSARSRGFAPLFFIAGIWSLPFALSTAAFVFFNNETFLINFEYLTFDLFLTLALLLYAVYAWRTNQDTERLWMIALVLVVSSLIALWETLIPGSLLKIIFAVLLIIPLLYELLFDADGLNHPGPERGARLIAILSAQAALMVIVAWEYALGGIGPNTRLWEAVAERVFLPGFLVLVLLNMKAERSSRLDASNTNTT